jgi:hypothetical protein
MFLIVCEQRLRDVEHRDDAFVGDPVKHSALLTSRLDEPTPPQAGEIPDLYRKFLIRRREPREDATRLKRIV